VSTGSAQEAGLAKPSGPRARHQVIHKSAVTAASFTESGPAGNFDVVCDRIDVRRSPSTEAAALGILKRGAVVQGSPFSIHGQPWLRLDGDCCESFGFAVDESAWILIDGACVGLGELLRRSCNGTDVSENLAELETVGWRRSSLTADWLKEVGGLAAAPRAIQECPMPGDMDLGLASNCAMLLLEPADGGPEESYIVKREGRGGSTAFAYDQRLQEREHRFYTEIAQRDMELARSRYTERLREPSDTDMNGSVENEGAPDLPGPLTMEERARKLDLAVGPSHLVLAGALRVPRCLASHWSPSGRALGAEVSVLVLETLAAPTWVRADHQKGCSVGQALTVVEALGRFHAMFARSDEVNKYSWLPVTPLDVELVDYYQDHFAACFETLGLFVRNHLSSVAFDACRRLCDRYSEVVARLARPPLTLVHGDFHLGNIMFSTTSPPVAAAFDWQFACRCRGAYDFAYFVALFAPPDIRRGCENKLVRRYLWACGRSGEAAEFADEVRAALLVIMSFYMMLNMNYFQRHPTTRVPLGRCIKWIGECMDDWGCDRLLD